MQPIVVTEVDVAPSLCPVVSVHFLSYFTRVLGCNGMESGCLVIAVTVDLTYPYKSLY